MSPLDTVREDGGRTAVPNRPRAPLEFRFTGRVKNVAQHAAEIAHGLVAPHFFERFVDGLAVHQEDPIVFLLAEVADVNTQGIEELPGGIAARLNWSRVSPRHLGAEEIGEDAGSN